MPIPKSTPKKLMRSMVNGVIAHTKKPDIDNLCKFVMDSLSGLLWQDDNQISLSLQELRNWTPPL